MKVCFCPSWWLWRKGWGWVPAWRASGPPELLFDIPFAFISQRKFSSLGFFFKSLGEGGRGGRKHLKKIRSLEWSATIHEQIIRCPWSAHLPSMRDWRKWHGRISAWASGQLAFVFYQNLNPAWLWDGSGIPEQPSFCHWFLSASGWGHQSPSLGYCGREAWTELKISPFPYLPTSVPASPTSDSS